MADNSTATDYRSPIISEPILMPPTAGVGGGDMGISYNYGRGDFLRTPAGNVRTVAANPPLPVALPMQYTTGLNGYGGGGYGGYNNNFGSYIGGYGGYGGFGGYGGYSGGYGNFNRYGMSDTINPMDPESRFIQIAEASSRPAFQSIESLVSAIGNIASMLDSTFFALTSSFRAILGVAANFGRLRGVFAQFWSTFAIFRTLSWMYRKILYWLRISNLDPSSNAFKKAFAEAVNNTNAQQSSPNLPPKGQSPWPVLAFLSFIFTAPYLVMKLLGTVTNTAHQDARNPSKWIQPIESVALYDFQARNPSELTMRAGQRIIIAPKEIQNTLALLHTGWAMATTDGQMTGIIPINYVKSPQQMRQEQLSKTTRIVQHNSMPTTEPSTTEINPLQPSSINSTTSTISVPPAQKQTQNIPDVNRVTQSIKTDIPNNVAIDNGLVAE